MKKLTIIFLLLLSSLYSKEQTLTISSGFTAPETDFLELVLKEGFKRSGIGLDYHTLPNQRSLFNANNGIADGEASRIWEINTIYPNLMRIPVSIHSIDLIVVSKRDITIKDVADLKKYNVGVIRGMKIAEKIVKEQSPLSMIAVTDNKTLMKMLYAQRIDIAVTNHISFLTDISDAKSNGFYIRKEPIVSRPLYMHLHKKHKELIPRFEKAFHSMIDDGTHKKIKEKFLSGIRQNARSKAGTVEYE